MAKSEWSIVKSHTALWSEAIRQGLVSGFDTVYTNS